MIATNQQTSVGVQPVFRAYVRLWVRLLDRYAKTYVDLVRCERCYLKSSEVVKAPVLSLQAVWCVYGSVITCQRAMVFVCLEYPHDGIALCVAAVEMALIMIECISFRADDTG
jgi:hypothetical protein